MQYNDGPEFPFFCHICGAPPTWRGLLADSTLDYLDPEEDDFDHREYRYMDFMPSMRDFGYDARLLPPRKIRWLDAVRLVTMKIVDTSKFTETEGTVPVLSPLAVHVGIDSGMFHYPENTNALHCNIDGYLVHDACFRMLDRVYQHLNTSSSLAQGLDLGRLWKWLELGLEDRNNDLVDWGFGDAFKTEYRSWSGSRFNPSYQEWIPVKGSMWTVLDPEGPFNCQPLLDHASTSTQPGYSFAFLDSAKLAKATPSAHLPPKANVNVNILSSLPRELQLNILELLPTSSVLNLFLASPEFRSCAENLPSSFWKSRLFFDVPWCADILLSHIQIAQHNNMEKEKYRLQFNRLLRFLKEFYKAPGQEPDDENLEFKGLRNRRRIWLLCERIVREMEVQQDDGSGGGNEVEVDVEVKASNSKAED
ncbi:hypothetical protein BDV19DRAFT_392913 [Aspergillus venezuelensis]